MFKDNIMYMIERYGSGVELRTLDYENAFFTLHCSSSLSSINEHLAIDSSDYVYEQSFAHLL